MVIWVLGFGAKVRPFTIYILNLTIADIGVLLSRAISFFFLLFTDDGMHLGSVHFQFFLFMCIVSQSLLTAIGIDRCLTTFFPVWRRHRQPAHLSVIVCVVVWILSFLFSALHLIRFSSGENENAGIMLYPFKLATLICLPLVTSCTVVLMIKVFFKSQQAQRAVLSTAMAITLLSSLLFVLPLNVICMIPRLEDVPPYILELGCLGACLNSSVNPLIYFLVGRKNSRSRELMRDVLQKVFQEGEEYREEMELEPPVQNQLQVPSLETQ
ncbi:mas-related G-protein coupled receptor member H-like [Varanus komodoensis]|uniref:mas-related G-protein coupled receptor member H-like n=1 Tax=Varanus komodoensis TaxID=61221 RepID=UPI001CF7753B|nr:mas-related G-protein coupled receptor member H-like [Varanus komodoensis]